MSKSSYHRDGARHGETCVKHEKSVAHALRSMMSAGSLCLSQAART